MRSKKPSTQSRLYNWQTVTDDTVLKDGDRIISGTGQIMLVTVVYGSEYYLTYCDGAPLTARADRTTIQDTIQALGDI